MEPSYPARELYYSREDFEIYRTGSKSVENMKKLIDISLEQIDKISGDDPGKTFSIEQLVRYIHDNIENEIRRTDIAGHFHLNPDYLARIFKKETGTTLKEFTTNERISIAKSLLQTTTLPVGMVAAKVGFGSLSHFSKVYLKTTGLTPTEERQAAKGSENARDKLKST